MNYAKFKESILQILRRYSADNKIDDANLHSDDLKCESKCTKADKSQNQKTREQVDSYIKMANDLIERDIEEYREHIKNLNPILDEKCIDIYNRSIGHLEMIYKLSNSIYHIDDDVDFMGFFEHDNLCNIQRYLWNISDIKRDCRNEIYKLRNEEKKSKESRRMLEFERVAKISKMRGGVK